MADPIGGGFCFPPDRTVCGPPPLEANLFAFCKGSLIYKRYVWVLPIPYPLSPIPYPPLMAYSLFPHPPRLPLLPIPYLFVQCVYLYIQFICSLAQCVWCYCLGAGAQAAAQSTNSRRQAKPQEQKLPQRQRKTRP